MVDKSGEVRCKFTGEIEKQGSRHIVAIPEAEIEYGTLAAGDIVRMVSKTTGQAANGTTRTETPTPVPPVSEGDRLTAEIEDIGDQSDGITRVDRGYVLIVPDTRPGDEVPVEIQQTNPNYGFAALVDQE